MGDHALFVIGPYAVLGVGLVSLFWRLLVRPADGPVESGGLVERLWSYATFRWGFLAVLALHATGILMPDQLLVWNRAAVRLFLVEAVGLGAGALLAVSLVRALLPHRGAEGPPPLTLGDTLLATVLGTTVVAGLLAAVTFQGSSSLFATVIAPYLRSLAVLDPNVELLAGMPFLVRLHLNAGLALAAVLPWSQLGAVVARKGRNGLRRLGGSAELPELGSADAR